MIKLKNLLNESVRSVKDVDVRGKNIPDDVIEGAYNLMTEYVQSDNIKKIIVADSYNKYTIHTEFKNAIDNSDEIKKNITDYFNTSNYDIVARTSRIFKFTIPK